MRVISGTARGRRLKEPHGYSIRPTSDMVKESIFNIIQFDIEGRRVLDLFAGTGQLGIEALSRGAKNAVFVDSKPDAGKLIRDNLKICDLQENAVVVTADALSFIRSMERVDLIFLDPPYDSGLAGAALQKIIEFDKLNENGIIMCETRFETLLPEEIPPPYCLHKVYKYGKIKLTRYGK